MASVLRYLGVMRFGNLLNTPDTEVEEICHAMNPNIGVGSECQIWYNNAIKHCNGLIAAERVAGNLSFIGSIHKFLKQFLQPPKNKLHEIENKLPQIDLTLHDCYGLLQNAATKYGSTTPQQILLAQENRTLWFITKILLFIVAFLTILVCFVHARLLAYLIIDLILKFWMMIFSCFHRTQSLSCWIKWLRMRFRQWFNPDAHRRYPLPFGLQRVVNFFKWIKLFFVDNRDLDNLEADLRGVSDDDTQIPPVSVGDGDKESDNGYITTKSPKLKKRPVKAVSSDKEQSQNDEPISKSDSEEGKMKKRVGKSPKLKKRPVKAVSSDKEQSQNDEPISESESEKGKMKKRVGKAEKLKRNSKCKQYQESPASDDEDDTIDIVEKKNSRKVKIKNKMKLHQKASMKKAQRKSYSEEEDETSSDMGTPYKPLFANVSHSGSLPPLLKKIHSTQSYTRIRSKRNVGVNTVEQTLFRAIYNYGHMTKVGDSVQLQAKGSPCGDWDALITVEEAEELINFSVPFPEVLEPEKKRNILQLANQRKMERVATDIWRRENEGKKLQTAERATNTQRSSSKHEIVSSDSELSVVQRHKWEESLARETKDSNTNFKVRHQNNRNRTEPAYHTQSAKTQKYQKNYTSDSDLQKKPSHRKYAVKTERSYRYASDSETENSDTDAVTKVQHISRNRQRHTMRPYLSYANHKQYTRNLKSEYNTLPNEYNYDRKIPAIVSQRFVNNEPEQKLPEQEQYQKRADVYACEKNTEKEMMHMDNRLQEPIMQLDQGIGGEQANVRRPSPKVQNDMMGQSRSFMLRSPRSQSCFNRTSIGLHTPRTNIRHSVPPCSHYPRDTHASKLRSLISRARRSQDRYPASYSRLAPVLTETIDLQQKKPLTIVPKNQPSKTKCTTRFDTAQQIPTNEVSDSSDDASIPLIEFSSHASIFKNRTFGLRPTEERNDDKSKTKNKDFPDSVTSTLPGMKNITFSSNKPNTRKSLSPSTERFEREIKDTDFPDSVTSTLPSMKNITSSSNKPNTRKSLLPSTERFGSEIKDKDFPDSVTSTLPSMKNSTFSSNKPNTRKYLSLSTERFGSEIKDKDFPDSVTSTLPSMKNNNSSSNKPNTLSPSTERFAKTLRCASPAPVSTRNANTRRSLIPTLCKATNKTTPKQFTPVTSLKTLDTTANAAKTWNYNGRSTMRTKSTLNMTRAITSATFKNEKTNPMRTTRTSTPNKTGSIALGTLKNIKSKPLRTRLAPVLTPTPNKTGSIASATLKNVKLKNLPTRRAPVLTSTSNKTWSIASGTPKNEKPKPLQTRRAPVLTSTPNKTGSIASGTPKIEKPKPLPTRQASVLTSTPNKTWSIASGTLKIEKPKPLPTRQASVLTSTPNKTWSIASGTLKNEKPKPLPTRQASVLTSTQNKTAAVTNAAFKNAIPKLLPTRRAQALTSTLNKSGAMTSSAFKNEKPKPLPTRRAPAPATGSQKTQTIAAQSANYVGLIRTPAASTAKIEQIPTFSISADAQYITNQSLRSSPEFKPLSNVSIEKEGNKITSKLESVEFESNLATHAVKSKQCGKFIKSCQSSWKHLIRKNFKKDFGSSSSTSSKDKKGKMAQIRWRSPRRFNISNEDFDVTNIKEKVQPEHLLRSGATDTEALQNKKSCIEEGASYNQKLYQPSNLTATDAVSKNERISEFYFIPVNDDTKPSDAKDPEKVHNVFPTKLLQKLGPTSYSKRQKPESANRSISPTQANKVNHSLELAHTPITGTGTFTTPDRQKSNTSIQSFKFHEMRQSTETAGSVQEKINPHGSPIRRAESNSMKSQRSDSSVISEGILDVIKNIKSKPILSTVDLTSEIVDMIREQRTENKMKNEAKSTLKKFKSRIPMPLSAASKKKLLPIAAMKPERLQEKLSKKKDGSS